MCLINPYKTSIYSHFKLTYYGAYTDSILKFYLLYYLLFILFNILSYNIIKKEFF